MATTLQTDLRIVDVPSLSSAYVSDNGSRIVETLVSSMDVLRTPSQVCQSQRRAGQPELHNRRRIIITNVSPFHTRNGGRPLDLRLDHFGTTTGLLRGRQGVHTRIDPMDRRPVVDQFAYVGDTSLRSIGIIECSVEL